jgi:hypothetical protein
LLIFQATSVLGHKRRTQGPVLLPTSDEERQNLRRDETLACEFDKRVEELERNFERVRITGFLSSKLFLYKISSTKRCSINLLAMGQLVLADSLNKALLKLVYLANIFGNRT